VGEGAHAKRLRSSDMRGGLRNEGTDNQREEASKSLFWLFHALRASGVARGGEGGEAFNARRRKTGNPK